MREVFALHEDPLFARVGLWALLLAAGRRPCPPHGEGQRAHLGPLTPKQPSHRARAHGAGPAPQGQGEAARAKGPPRVRRGSRGWGSFGEELGPAGALLRAHSALEVTTRMAWGPVLLAP